MRRSALGAFLLAITAGCAQTPAESPYEPKNTATASSAKERCVSTGSHVKGKCSSGSTYSNAEAMKTQDTSVTIRKSPTGPTAK
jgi:hypothetical protein